MQRIRWPGGPKTLRGSKIIARNDRKNRKTQSKTGADTGDTRRPHSIRFSDSEWTLIEDAALRHGISAGEIVRSGALAVAEQRLAAPIPATVSPGHLALIEATFRTVYVLATLRREELLNAGRKDEIDEIDEIVKAARSVMVETMNEGPA